MTTSKAIAGAIVSIIVALFTKYGIVLTPEVADSVRVIIDVLIAALLGYIGVYLAPKNKER